ncbi:MAG: hypothetical protein JO211_09805 [Acidobacteriaceae bacterium]|nr:hypothetical protein [Acidobacteriaceae bacterium]MBV9405626.1 hypothetical protein [Acidobacteriaceae bacterium]
MVAKATRKASAEAKRKVTQAKLFRQRANSALRMATISGDEDRKALIGIASDWLRAAEQLDPAGGPRRPVAGEFK